MLIFGYVGYTLFIVCYELIRTRKCIFDILTIFNIFFALEYLIVPIFFLYAPEKQHLWTFLALRAQSADSFLVLAIILVAHFSLLSGYSIGQKTILMPGVNLLPKVCERKQLRVLTITFLFFLFLFYIYAIGHGGLVKLATSGAFIRSGAQSGGYTDYIKHFASGIIYIPFLSLSLAKNAKDPGTKHRSLVLFVFSFIIAIIEALGTGGRGAFGMLFISLYMLWQNMTTKFLTWKTVAGLSAVFCFSLFMINYGRSAIYALTANQTGESYSEVFINHSSTYLSKQATLASTYDWAVIFVSRFDHRFASLYPALTELDHFDWPRLFWDYPRSLLGLVPGNSAPDVFVSSRPARLNQLYFEQFTQLPLGYVPLGWIGQKLINGGVVWLVLHGFFAGFIGGKIYKTISIKNLALSPALALLFAIFWRNHILAIEPKDLIYRNLNLIFYVIVFLNIFKITFSKSTKTLYTSVVDNKYQILNK